MVTKALPTEFAPAERATEETLSRQIEMLKSIPLLDELYGAVSEIVMILNRERQIVYFNNKLIKLLNPKNPASLYGKRPGEALHCVHADECAGGCGTTEFCSTCGAARAILTSQKGKPNVQECRIARTRKHEALELQVSATPIEFSGEQFTIFSVNDISNEKRRQVLEQIFFHDVLNTASYLQVASDILRKGNEDTPEVREVFFKGITELIEEINNQKVIASAECDELVVRPVILKSQEIIDEMLGRYEKLAEKEKVHLGIGKNTDDVKFSADRSLIIRVLGNMIKNAIEASKPRDMVTISQHIEKGRVHFAVHNPAFIPRKIQLQIFQRSFSTKGTGRGIGTYSMKLLSERYLDGRVSFSSTKKSGTIFTASFPISA